MVEKEFEEIAEERFSILANRTRASILRAVWEADDEISFSDLRKKVGVEDSGKFNYHLGKLVDEYISKGESGYSLMFVGHIAVGTVLSGRYEAEYDLEPIEIESECPNPDCESSSLRMEYKDESVEVECTECDTSVLTLGVPPIIMESHERDELPETINRWLRSMIAQEVSGFCYVCSGKTHPSIITDVDTEIGINHAVNYTCDLCRIEATLLLSMIFLHQPEVVSFYHQRGTKIAETPIWNLPHLAHSSDYEEKISDDPLRFRVEYPAEDDSLFLTVNEDLEVVESEIV